MRKIMSRFIVPFGVLLFVIYGLASGASVIFKNREYGVKTAHASVTKEGYLLRSSVVGGADTHVYTLKTSNGMLRIMNPSYVQSYKHGAKLLLSGTLSGSNFTLDGVTVTVLMSQVAPVLLPEEIPSVPNPQPQSVPKLIKKVLVINFDPYVTGTTPLSTYMGWGNIIALQNQYEVETSLASNGFVDYQIVRTDTYRDFPYKENSYKFNMDPASPDYYFRCLPNNPNGIAKCAEIIDYPRLINDYNICGQAQAGQIDEVWLWGAPYFGYWEHVYAGPSIIPPYIHAYAGTCGKYVPIMGFSYERGITEMLHNFGHRTESAMTSIYGYYPYYPEVNFNNPWSKFTAWQGRNPGNAACGNVHYTPNALDEVQDEYVYTKTNFASSTCNDYLNYPNLTGAVQNLNCSTWECSGYGYLKYWLRRLPNAVGTIGNVMNNWWRYVVDYEYSIAFPSRNYCPSTPVTRDQMAVFLLRTKHGAGYYPPAITGTPIFADVPATHWAGAFIQQLAAEGITGGCGGGNYCPTSNVTRDSMAIFLLRVKHGSSYAPPPPQNPPMFADVPNSYWAAAWIEQLAREGITSGCGGGNYCPTASVNRDQMSVFLLKTKYGSSYWPSDPTGQVFFDVPTTHWAARFIEQLKAEQITGGCS